MQSIGACLQQAQKAFHFLGGRDVDKLAIREDPQRFRVISSNLLTRAEHPEEDLPAQYCEILGKRHENRNQVTPRRVGLAPLPLPHFSARFLLTIQRHMGGRWRIV